MRVWVRFVFCWGLVLGLRLWRLLCGSCARFVRVRVCFVLCWGLFLRVAVFFVFFLELACTFFMTFSKDTTCYSLIREQVCVWDPVN